MENNTFPQLKVSKNQAILNIRKMQYKANQNNAIFRPHFKTHQSKDIAQWFKNEQIGYCTVSNLEMAEYFAEHNWNDITIAFPFIPSYLSKTESLATKITLNIVVSNYESAQYLATYLSVPLKVWMEIDVGYHRTGFDYRNRKLINKSVKSLNGNTFIHFEGFLSHFGNTYNAGSKDEILRLGRESVAKLLSLREDISPDAKVSIGDTPYLSIETEPIKVDEIRPGNFVFYDLMQLHAGCCKEEEIAAWMTCKVAATYPERHEIVIHGGAVHFSKEYLVKDGMKIYGQVARLQHGKIQIIEGAYLTSLSQEHGIISNDKVLDFNPEIGDELMVIPVHSCLTADLQNFYIQFPESNLLETKRSYTIQKSLKSYNER